MNTATPKDRSIDACGRTDRGRVRSVNEDHFLIGQLDKSLLVAETSMQVGTRRVIGAPEGQLLCVADGLGGHAAGERASASALDSTLRYILHTMPCFFRARHLSDDQLHDELTAAVQLARTELSRLSANDPELRGMGTTLTLALLQWPWLHLVHVGDSRCYLMRDGLRQLSTDHTLLQRLIDQGAVTPAQAQGSRLGHALWNAIGDRSDMYVELGKYELRAGDTLLLCTDGLTRHVTDATIRDVLASAADAADATNRLVDAANAGGGSDNITVIVARIPVRVDDSEVMRLQQDPVDATRLDEAPPTANGSPEGATGAATGCTEAGATRSRSAGTTDAHRSIGLGSRCSRRVPATRPESPNPDEADMNTDQHAEACD